jgi:hypothetical protein
MYNICLYVGSASIVSVASFHLVFDVAEHLESRLPSLVAFPEDPDLWRELHLTLKGESNRGCRVSQQFREALARHANSNKNQTSLPSELDAIRNMRAWCRTRKGVSRMVVPSI